MKYFKYISVFFALIVFSSCDYTACNRYIIINDTNSDLVIKTNIQTLHIGLHFSDTIHIVESKKQIKFSQDLGICGKKYIPGDIYHIKDSVPFTSKFDMYIDRKLQNELRLRSNWEYIAKEREGIYTLHITTELLENITTDNE